MTNLTKATRFLADQIEKKKKKKRKEKEKERKETHLFSHYLSK